MPPGGNPDVGREASVAETLKLFVLPPLLTFALIAFSLLLLAGHLAQEELQTTFVVERVAQPD
jgi:hypothetical protein